ncbi:hypothetical protein PR001_g14237 [Phytophthora rubi]|nr:hypothetical protein PR001_g14237 [Phytophthora rubi]
MEAARMGHIDVLTFLLTSGASVDSVNFDGRTPLHLAVTREQSKLSEFCWRLMLT